MILTREQIDSLHGHARHDDCWMCDVIDTARAYHDLRDGVLNMPPITDAYIDFGRQYQQALRAVVARVERGES